MTGDTPLVETGAGGAPDAVRPIFGTLALVGIGLIGSSIARAVRRFGLADRIVIADHDAHARAAARRLELGDQVVATAAEAAAVADCVVLCTPLGTFEAVAQEIAPALRPGTVVTDVGSVKDCVVRDVAPHLPEGVHLVPGHPLAGTEHSGPEAGFAELFLGRWAILTPPEGTDAGAVAQVEALWRGMGSMVRHLPSEHHDKVLAITSHLPHLIAYTIVGTATQLGDDLREEVIQYSATGFRDFTRIAASDPIMWRDVFLKNRDAVLEIIQRFGEDLTELQKAIRRGEADKLEDLFTRTRAIRRGIIDAKQA
ncbi:MAG: prephenate/arogenate dehydrogenase family protein [Rhodospirillaceae bacterium]|nr:prephenate/arogenate dehydrogenase family protein [Rhodospirillaceae bacterium]